MSHFLTIYDIITLTTSPFAAQVILIVACVLAARCDLDLALLVAGNFRYFLVPIYLVMRIPRRPLLFLSKQSL